MDRVNSVGPACLASWPGAMLVLCLVLYLGGCSSMQPSIPLVSMMPADGAVAGWSPDSDVQTFDKETLFRYADGGAEFFLLYGFEQMAVRSYIDDSGASMEVEVWRLATPDD